MDSPVSTREVTVNLENGLHLGPSSQIARLAQTFASDVLIRKADRAVDAKSMMDLITLVAEQGTLLTLEARGADAVQAVESLAKLFESNFKTDEQAAG